MPFIHPPVPISQTPTPTESNTPYLVSVVVMSLLGVGGVIAVLLLRPNQDNAAILAAIGGFVAPTTMALLAFLKTKDTHVLVNGRMEEFRKLLTANAAQEIALSNARSVAQGMREAHSLPVQPSPFPTPPFPTPPFPTPPLPAPQPNNQDLAWLVVPMLMLDFETGKIVSISKPAEELFGYLPGQLVGQPVEGLLPPGLRERHRAHVEGYRLNPQARPMGQGTNLSLKGLKRDGTEFQITVQLMPVTYNSQACAVAVIAEATTK